MPDCAYRHRYQTPSAVSRLRSQFRQKGVVVEAIIPKAVPSGNLNRSAGADEFAPRGSIVPYLFVRRSSISARGKTLSLDQFVAPPTSMYSMKRTSASA